jgi:hypothetical protein
MEAGPLEQAYDLLYGSVCHSQRELGTVGPVPCFSCPKDNHKCRLYFIQEHREQVVRDKERIRGRNYIEQTTMCFLVHIDIVL